MSGTISFDQVPADWRVPGAYVEIRPINRFQGLAEYRPRALLIGQMLTGTAAAEVPQRITRRDQATALFGAGSALEDMIQTFLDANTTTELWAMGLPASGGAAAASGTIALTGSPTAAGTLAVYIRGRRVAVPVAAAATPTVIATALAAAINAAVGLPVTAASTTGTVTLTARHLGAIGNFIDVRVNYQLGDATPPGLTVTITAMASGTGTPVLTAALAAIAADPFTDICLGFPEAGVIGVLATELARRYGAMVGLDAHGYAALSATHGTLLTLGAAQNSPHLTIIGANASPSPPWAWAASLCGRAAFHMANDPARQMRGITLPGILPPAVTARFTTTEQDQLLRDGISTWDAIQDGTVVLSRVITAYQVSNLGVADTAWLDIMVPKTMSRIRFDWRAYLQLSFPRHKLADDGSPAAEFNDNIVTPRIMASVWGTRCKLYERLGWIEDIQRTIADSTFVRNASDRNRLDARQRVRVIGNLMVFAAALEFEA
jgi:phage tail sheath gpL-like